ncbi:reverse transcriptase homolog protein [Elysia marginata]|uniref:Reverse transcriptase homolog protein n=1 Tax=Elysia marginata TaxID=1093978 RepID=A0AAV4I361_9GAST|nr:reverse transcriptase homolog protein [Elysia marginata]
MTVSLLANSKASRCNSGFYMWPGILVTEVLVYSSYGIFINLSRKDGNLEYHSSSIWFSVECLKADEVPGSLPRKSPPQATGGNNNEMNTILTILHWNAKGISRKKLALANRLKKEDIDVACIQESHLIPHPKHGRRFTMKGYQTFKKDRQDGPKGGVITLVKSDITASEIKVNSGDRAEMIGTELHFKDKNNLQLLLPSRKRTCSTCYEYKRPVHCGRVL